MQKISDSLLQDNLECCFGLSTSDSVTPLGKHFNATWRDRLDYCLEEEDSRGTSEIPQVDVSPCL